MEAGLGGTVSLGGLHGPRCGVLGTVPREGRARGSPEDGCFRVIPRGGRLGVLFSGSCPWDSGSSFSG